jgi:hypothetical protein
MNMVIANSLFDGGFARRSSCTNGFTEMTKSLHQVQGYQRHWHDAQEDEGVAVDSRYCTQYVERPRMQQGR